jgi:hypothetical protein
VLRQHRLTASYICAFNVERLVVAVSDIAQISPTLAIHDSLLMTGLLVIWKGLPIMTENERIPPLIKC